MVDSNMIITEQSAHLTGAFGKRNLKETTDQTMMNSSLALNTKFTCNSNWREVKAIRLLNEESVLGLQSILSLHNLKGKLSL
jgi:hypothetical protein